MRRRLTPTAGRELIPATHPIASPPMFRTVKAVRQELHRRGGYIETIRDTELAQYAPHLSMTEQGWPHGIWIKDELLGWANETQIGTICHPDWY